ncbi:MAG: hypothetical protein ACXVFK_15710 [Solirubrobacteraceae bacterium]
MYGDDKLDWHADYAGGWHELFANAGDACVVDGVPLPFHGEASTARWDVVTHDDDALVLRVASRLPVVLERRMRLAGDRAALLLEETVTNVGTGPVEILWAHHPTFAARPGMRIDVPAGAVHADAGWRPTHLDVEAGAEGRWPQLGAADLSRIPDGRSEHLCFLPDLDGGWAALRDPGGSGAALAWDAAVWPHMWRCGSRSAARSSRGTGGRRSSRSSRTAPGPPMGSPPRASAARRSRSRPAAASRRG